MTDDEIRSLAITQRLLGTEAPPAQDAPPPSDRGDFLATRWSTGGLARGDGRPLWAHRYRLDGRGSARPQIKRRERDAQVQPPVVGEIRSGGMSSPSDAELVSSSSSTAEPGSRCSIKSSIPAAN
jgi:hypothetical protein